MIDVSLGLSPLLGADDDADRGDLDGSPATSPSASASRRSSSTSPTATRSPPAQPPPLRGGARQAGRRRAPLRHARRRADARPRQLQVRQRRPRPRRRRRAAAQHRGAAAIAAARDGRARARSAATSSRVILPEADEAAANEVAELAARGPPRARGAVGGAADRGSRRAIGIACFDSEDAASGEEAARRGRPRDVRGQGRRAATGPVTAAAAAESRHHGETRLGWEHRIRRGARARACSSSTASRSWTCAPARSASTSCCCGCEDGRADPAGRVPGRRRAPRADPRDRPLGRRRQALELLERPPDASPRGQPLGALARRPRAAGADPRAGSPSARSIRSG